MPMITLIEDPTTVTTRWLEKHFKGYAPVAEFALHFSENYVSSKGTRIPVTNVYSRIRRDELRGLVVRDPD